MRGGGWTIAPVWLKDLCQLRPCLLYICIAQFRRGCWGAIGGQAAHIWGCYNSVSSGSPSCLPASRRGWRLIGNHLVWLTRICSDQYLAPGPTWWEKTNEVFVYLEQVFTLAVTIQYQNTSIWSEERTVNLEMWDCGRCETTLKNVTDVFVSLSRFVKHLLPLKSRSINKDNCIWIRALKWSTMQFH